MTESPLKKQPYDVYIDCTFITQILLASNAQDAYEQFKAMKLAHSYKLGAEITFLPISSYTHFILTE